MEMQTLVGTTEGLHELGDSGRVSLPGHKITALARDGSTWWAIVDRKELWRSESGDEWAHVASAESLALNCVLATPASLFLGTSEANLLKLRGETLEGVGPFDSIEGREEWHTPWGGPPDVRSLSSDGSSAIYANVHVGGVARSTDGGDSWEPTIDIASDVHEVMFDPTSGLLLAASARGLAQSADQGSSWTFDADGLHGRYLRAVTAAEENVLVSASTGPYTDRAAVYRRALDGKGNFQKCHSGLPEWFGDNVDSLCLAAAGRQVVFGTSEGSVFHSDDEGESWTAVAEGLPSIRCVAFG